MSDISANTAEPMRDKRFPVSHVRRVILFATLGFILCASLLAYFDRDISHYRFLSNDLMVREATENNLSPYPAEDPSSYGLWIPSLIHVKRNLESGELPFWDRLQGGGNSPLLLFQNGVLSPLRWMSVFVDEPQAPSFQLILGFFLSFLGVFLLLWELQRSVFASIAGAMLFSGSPYCLSIAPFDGLLVFCYLPFIIFGYFRWTRTHRPKHLTLVIATTGLSFYSGHPVLLFCALLTSGIFILCDIISRSARNDLEPIILGALASIGLAGLVLLPFGFELFSAWSYKTETGHGTPYFALNLIDWLDAVKVVVFGHKPPIKIDLFPYYGFIGLPTLTLGLLGLARIEPRYRFLRLVLPITFLLSVPGPWMSVVGAIPLISSAKIWYIFVSFSFCICVCAAFGIDRLTELVPLQLSLALPILICTLSFTWPFARSIDAYKLVHEPTPMSSKAYDFLRQDDETFRVTGLWGQVHMPNTSILSGIEDLRLSSPILSERYHRWFKLVDPLILQMSYPTVRLTHRLDSPLVGAFNVKYVLSGKVRFRTFTSEIVPGDGWGSTHPDQWPLDESLFPVVYEDKYLRIHKLKQGFRPRVYFADKVIPVGNINEAEKWIQSNEDELKEAVVVESPSEHHTRLRSLTSTNTARIELTYPSDREVSVVSNSTQAGLLVLADIYEEGWKAWVNGVETEILPVNILARGLVLDAGRNVIRMRYTPPWIWEGLGLSLISCLLIVLWLIRRQKTTDGPSPEIATGH